jgi:toxin FitB
LFLLDTNVVSELRKGSRAHTALREWIAPIDDSALFLSVVVVGELRQGVERLRLRDAPQAARLDRWLLALMNDYADRILQVDLRVADLWGRMNVPNPISAVDGLLAATAIVHDLILVTRNVKDVEQTGAKIHNPFQT